MKATDRNRPASTLGSSKVSIRPGALLRADPDNRLPQRAMEFLRTLGLLEGVMTQGVIGSQGKGPDRHVDQ